MTAGAVAAICIFDNMLGADWRRDRSVLEGMQWINKHFTVTDNPGLPGKHHYYYLYALERAGMLFGTERIGDNMWYRTGAEYLLANQDENGNWDDEGPFLWSKTVDTCFAILFLKRVTRALIREGDVATGGCRRR